MSGQKGLYLGHVDSHEISVFANVLKYYNSLYYFG